MVDKQITHSSEQVMESNQVKSSPSSVPAWRIVLAKELSELWIGGKALYLVLIYSILLGVISWVMASNSELSLIPPKEMVFETLKISIAFGGFIGLIIGADSISGERERSTLEWLLLTPASRRQMVMGKFLAAATPWPAALVVSIPFWYMLSQGDEAFGQALLWGTLLGSLLIPALTGLGMLVSFWSNSNKTSMFVSLALYLLVLVPTQLPGSAQTGAMGKLLKKVSPMESVYHFLEKIIVNNRTLDELWSFLLAPGLFALIVVGVLWFISPGISLESGQSNKLGAYLSRIVGAFMVACLLLSLGALPVVAQEDGASPLQISISMDVAEVRAGDPVLYDTVVANNGSEESSALIVAMNIINLDSEGDVVDPEDWSPERTQYLEPLEPGEEASLSWRVNAILDGDYMVYMVVIPEPEGQQETTQPVASSGIHLTVTPFTRLNPSGVLPLVIIIPIVLVAVIGFLFWRRRRSIDIGAAE